MRFFRYVLPAVIAAVLIQVQPVAAQAIQVDLPPRPAPKYDPLIDPIEGPARAPVMLIEYGDFECPYCEQFQPTMKAILRKNRGRVSHVFRHFPLMTIHPQALAAAQASDCALRQGGSKAFWKYAAALFEAEELSDAELRRLARWQKLNMSTFQRCIDNKDLKMAMEINAHNAEVLGLKGTPTTYVVNRLTGDFERIEGAVPEKTLQEAIDRMRQKLPQLPAHGTPLP